MTDFPPDMSPYLLFYRIQQLEEDVQAIEDNLKKAFYLLVANLGGIVAVLAQQLFFG